MIMRVKVLLEGKREKMLLKREHGRAMPFNQTEPVFHTSESFNLLHLLLMPVL